MYWEEGHFLRHFGKLKGNFRFLADDDAHRPTDKEQLLNRGRFVTVEPRTKAPRSASLRPFTLALRFLVWLFSCLQRVFARRQK